MTLIYGDTGRASMGVLKTITVSYPFTENNLTAEDLPLSSPTAPQITFTINDSMMPIFSNGFTSFWKVCMLWAGGINNSGTNPTIYYEVSKNGSVWQSGNKTNVTSTQYWTFSMLKYDTVAINIGDVITVKLWTTATGVSYYYNGYMILPSRVDLGLKVGTILKDLSVVTTNPQTLIIGASGGGVKGSSWLGGICYLNTNSNGVFTSYGGNIILPTMAYFNTTYKLYSIQGGDFFQGTMVGINNSATFMPQMNQNAVPSTITFREITL